jgi:hypothetical protein
MDRFDEVLEKIHNQLDRMKSSLRVRGSAPAPPDEEADAENASSLPAQNVPGPADPDR